MQTVLPSSIRAWLTSPGRAATRTIIVAADQRTSRVALAFGGACRARSLLSRRCTFPSSCVGLSVARERVPAGWARTGNGGWRAHDGDAFVVRNGADRAGAVAPDAGDARLHVLRVVWEAAGEVLDGRFGAGEEARGARVVSEALPDAVDGVYVGGRLWREGVRNGRGGYVEKMMCALEGWKRTDVPDV